MPSPLAAARRFRAQILAADSAAAARITRAYAVAFSRINSELERTTARIARSRAAGEPVTTAMLYREGHLQRLRALALEEVQRFSGQATAIIDDGRVEAGRLGGEGARTLVDQVTPPGLTQQPLFGAAINTDAVATAVGNFRSQAIRSILDPLGRTAAQGVEDAIVSGIARGQNPRVIAREVRQHLGGNLTRALTISRTEAMRAHRDASLQVYRRHADLLAGWTWVAGLGARTCASCAAQHGSVHPLDEPMASHPRCRCVAVPASRSWADIGIPGMDDQQPIETGAHWFARQPEALQRRILGPSKLAALKDGRMSLGDFVRHDQHALWGQSTRAGSLQDALAAAKRGSRAWSCGSPCRLAEFRHATAADIKALKIPPAWTDVRIAKDAKSPLQVIGKDAKGRAQYRYSAEHTARQSALKYERLSRFGAELDEKILPSLARDITGGASQEEALVLRLIHRTGFRVGSRADTGAKVQAFGATTLRAEHVRIDGDILHFSFTGKKGVQIEHTMEDAEMARLLAPRIARGGDLFATTDTKVRDYLRSIDGNHKVKDFRTWAAQQTALAAIKRMPTPKTLSEFKSARLEVGRVVARHLGNTPTVALESYIDPRVFQVWGEF